MIRFLARLPKVQSLPSTACPSRLRRHQAEMRLRLEGPRQLLRAFVDTYQHAALHLPASEQDVSTHPYAATLPVPSAR